MADERANGLMFGIDEEHYQELQPIISRGLDLMGACYMALLQSELKQAVGINPVITTSGNSDIISRFKSSEEIFGPKISRPWRSDAGRYW